MVKNTKEWLESRKKRKERKERKKRAAKDGRASEEPAVLGFPVGGFREQIERLLDAARRERGDA